MGRGFTSGGQESGSVFSTSMCIIQASKRYIMVTYPSSKESTSLASQTHFRKWVWLARLGKHIALFIMALIVALVYIVPFTLLLLFAPCIQASKHWVVKHLQRRINPLLDAYQLRAI